MPSEENWRETVDSILSLSPPFTLRCPARFVRTCGNSLWALSFQWISHGTRYNSSGPIFTCKRSRSMRRRICNMLAVRTHIHSHTHTLAHSVCICICIRICFSCCLAWINYPGAHCSTCEYTNVFQYCRIGLKAKAKTCRLCGIVQHIPVTCTMYNILVLSLNARQHCM